MTDAHTPLPSPPAILVKEVHAALKAWNATPDAGATLDDLYLVQLARADGAANRRRAANQVLQSALNALANLQVDWPEVALLPKVDPRLAPVYYEYIQRMQEYILIPRDKRH